MSKVTATKKNNSSIIFDLPDKTEEEALKYARSFIRQTIWDNVKKRLYGWTFKIK